MSESPTPAPTRRARDAAAVDPTLPPVPADQAATADAFEASTPSAERYGHSRRSQPATGRNRLFRVVALVAIVAAAALVAWLVMRDDGAPTGDTATGGASAVTPTQLANLATSVGHPVYWLGPKADSTYELVQTTDGSIYVRYLPRGATIGTKDPYLTVATYPFAGAYAAIQAVSSEKGSSPTPIPGNGLAETPDSTATSVHAAFPGVDYQIEVFDPTPGKAAALVKAGGSAAVGRLRFRRRRYGRAAPGNRGRARHVRRHGRSSRLLGRDEERVRLRAQANGGRSGLHSLPADGIGCRRRGQHFTVGTYPYPAALDAIKALAKEPNAESFPVPGGGLAVVDAQSSKNIHLAYPDSDYQIEVFNPSPAAARNIVASGQIKSIG